MHSITQEPDVPTCKGEFFSEKKLEQIWLNVLPETTSDTVLNKLVRGFINKPVSHRCFHTSKEKTKSVQITHSLEVNEAAAADVDWELGDNKDEDESVQICDSFLQQK